MNICQVLTVGYISSVLFYVFGIFHKFLFENGEELAERGGRRKKWQAEERAERQMGSTGWQRLIAHSSCVLGDVLISISCWVWRQVPVCGVEGMSE